MIEESRDGEVGEAKADGDTEDNKEAKGEVMPVEEVEEGTKAKAMRQPYQLTPVEIAEHELTHIPFRDWCVHCMKGRGQSNQHRCQKGNKDIEDEKKVGALTTFSMIITDLEELGYGGTKILLKSDQESAIAEVQREIVRRRMGITVPINSAVGDSKGNGDVESAVKRLRGQLRTMRDDLEAKLKTKIRHNDPIMDWMIPWAAGLVTRYSKKDSGKSAYEDIRGKAPSTPIAAFGERILYMPKLEDKQQARFSSGIFVGSSGNQMRQLSGQNMEFSRLEPFEG